MNAATLRVLQPAFTLETVFMAVGVADSAVVREAAGFVDRVYAVDIAVTGRRPPNIVQVSASSHGIPVPDGSVHVAIGDAMVPPAHLWRALAPGGRYFCAGGVPEVFREAGFSRVRAYVGWLRLPFFLARHFAYRLVAQK